MFIHSQCCYCHGMLSRWLSLLNDRHLRLTYSTLCFCFRVYEHLSITCLRVAQCCFLRTFLYVTLLQFQVYDNNYEKIYLLCLILHHLIDSYNLSYSVIFYFLLLVLFAFINICDQKRSKESKKEVQHYEAAKKS